MTQLDQRVRSSPQLTFVFRPAAGVTYARTRPIPGAKVASERSHPSDPFGTVNIPDEATLGYLGQLVEGITDLLGLLDLSALYRVNAENADWPELLRWSGRHNRLIRLSFHSPLEIVIGLTSGGTILGASAIQLWRKLTQLRSERLDVELKRQRVRVASALADHVIEHLKDKPPALRLVQSGELAPVIDNAANVLLHLDSLALADGRESSSVGPDVPPRDG